MRGRQVGWRIGMNRMARGLVVIGLMAGLIGVTPGPVQAVPTATMELRAPAEIGVGELLEVEVVAPPSAGAVEAAITFDAEALEFGGIYFADPTTRVLTVTNHEGRAEVGAYGCASPACTSLVEGRVASMTVRFTVLVAGQHTIGLHRGLAVGTSGDIVAEAAVGSATVAVGEGPATGGGSVGALSTSRRPVAVEAADVTFDGRVDGSDVTDVGMGWTEARLRGDPCPSGDARLDRLDIDASGCIDVADLAALAAVSEPRIDRGGLQLDGARAADDGAGPDAGAAAVSERPPMVVNSTSDEWDRQLSNEICDTAAGVCSLRAALHQANWNPGPDTIHFDIPGTGPHRIVLREQLYITDTTGPVTIDGFTEPGASPNTDPFISNANIRIELQAPGYTSNGFAISSPDNTIRGIAIYGGFSNIRLTGPQANGNRLIGNHIGTNAVGTYQYTTNVTDQAGVEIVDGASSNVIGTPALADRNVISGNTYSGVRVNHAATVGNIIQNNLIGLTPSGTNKLYTYVAGIDVQWGANETWVGGYQEHAGNVVVGNTNYGIDLSHSSKNNHVIGNRLGTDATGTRVFSYTRNLIGLAIKDNTVGNTIEYNIMGGNTWDGIWHRHNFTGPNTFRHNRVGVGADGSNVGNVRNGMSLTGHDDTYRDNMVANNGDTGVSISSYNGGNGFSPPEYTQRNLISTSSFFSNGGPAISISGAHNNIAAPRITTARAGYAAGTACGSCTVEVYLAAGDEGRRYVGSTVAATNGTWTISAPAIGVGSIVALAISSTGDTSAFSGAVSSGPGNASAASAIAPIADRTVGEGDWDGVTPVVTNPDGDHLVFHVLGLPWGMTIDRATGLMSGRPTSSGMHRVTVTVDDGDSLVSTSFRWNVVSANARASIGGSVSEAGAGVVAGVDVDLFSEGRAQWLASTATDGAGSYAFDVAPGCYVLTFVAPSGTDFDTGTYKNHPICVGPAETRTDVNEVVIRAGQGSTAVGGRVVDEAGAPIAAVSIDLFSADTNGIRQAYLRSSQTAADGTYRFDLATAGCHVAVLVAPTGRTFTSGSAWAERGACPADGQELLGLDATLAGGGNPNDQGTIRGSITQAAGANPPALGVDLFQANADGSRGSWLRSTSSGEADAYQFSVAPGCYVLVFIAPAGSSFPGGSLYNQVGTCVAAGATSVVDGQLG